MICRRMIVINSTKKIIVDNIKPEIDVTLNKPISTADGTAYYDGKIDATLKINEANFYSEDVMGYGL